MQTNLPTEASGLFRPNHEIIADVAIIFGMSVPERPANHAAQIYHQGLVSRLLFTGGANPKLSEPEAHLMAQTARVAGVPDSDIWIEDQARHTDENARLSHQFIRSQNLAADTVLIVTMEVHLARCLLATRRWFAPTTRIGWSCYQSRYYSAATWEASAKGRQDVAAELGKLKKYYGALPADAFAQTAKRESKDHSHQLETAAS